MPKKELKEIKKLFDLITDKCFLNQRIHDLAYELNNEYKLLWDNLGEKLQKKLIISRTILKIRPALVKLTLTIATCGVFFLIELIFRYIKNKKDIAYVTSEAFTNTCRLLNTRLIFENQENSNKKTYETVEDVDNSNIKKYEGVEEIDNYTIIKTLIILFLVILFIYILSL